MIEFSPIPVKVTRSSLSISECPQELANLLQYTRQDIAHSGGNFVSTPVPVSYGHYDPRSKLCRTYPNALHLVRKHADSIHQTLVINDQRGLPELDLTQVNRKDYRSVCFDALEAIAKAKSSGLVIAPTGTGKTSIICGLVKMAPKQFKILVTTEDRNVALQLHKALSEAILDEKIGLYSKPTSITGRIMVTHLDALKDFTQGELAYSQYGLRDFQVWICDEVHRLPVPSRIQFLSEFRTTYCWGLTATPSRADNSHVLNEVVFGPVLYSASHQDVLDRQSKNGESGIVPVKVLVFPLPTEAPIPDDEPLFAKIKAAYLKNPLLRQLLFGILASLPDIEDAKIMIFVDTRRLGFLISKWIPGFTFVHGMHSLDYREQVLQKFKNGVIKKVICTDIWSEGIDVPDLQFVIDCSAKVAPNRVIQRAGRAARSSGAKAAGFYIMLLSTSSEHLFNQGVRKLQNISQLGWDVQYMIDRQSARSLPFEQAPLLTELGRFVK